MQLAMHCIMTNIHPRLKRRYNLCYRARKKGYVIYTKERTMYRPARADLRIEKNLYKYGFVVQLTIFEDGRNNKTTKKGVSKV